MRAGALVAVALAACHAAPPPTTAAPRGCPTAPVRVTDQAGLDALAGCARLAGLELRGAVPFDLTPLASLAAVDGELAVRSTFALGALRLPALTRVGGAVRVLGNLELGGVYLPALASAGAIVVEDSPVLVELMLPALRRVAGDLALARLASLELVDASSLPAVGGALRLAGTPRLTAWYGATEAAALAQVTAPTPSLP